MPASDPDDRTQHESLPPAAAADTALPTGALHPIAESRLRGNPARPDMVAVGTIVWLASELMFFSVFFIAYFTIGNVTASKANGGPTLFETRQQLLNPMFALANTFILVTSSVTCQLGVMKVHGADHQLDRTGKLWQLSRWGMREWYVLTFILGSIFVSGQVYEYAELIREGLTISSDAYGSVFYLATGFHGLHVTGGLFAFLLVLGRTFLARTWTHEQAVSVVVVSYYWHFVDVVWIVLFAVIYGEPISIMVASLLS